MNQQLRQHADEIIRDAIRAVLPDAAVKRALEGKEYPGRVLLVAAGKAAWQMAKAASDHLGDRIEAGVVVTKYGHVMGRIADFDCYEAGHPVPDENSFRGTQAAVDLVNDLSPEDTVLFLLSGGGSALFENPDSGCGAQGYYKSAPCLRSGTSWRSTRYASAFPLSRAADLLRFAPRR